MSDNDQTENNAQEPEKEHLAVVSATVIFDSSIGKIEHTFVDERPITKLSM